MSDPRASFATLEDSTGVGVPLAKAIDATTAVAGLNGQIGFAFKDSSGNAIMPQLLANGKIAVDTENSSGTPLKSRVVNSSGSATPVTLASITLTASKVYVNVQFQVACRKGGFFQVIFTDNGTPNILFDVVLDAGQYTFSGMFSQEKFTAGATGAQTLTIVGNNWGSGGNLSALYSSLAVLELDAIP